MGRQTGTTKFYDNLEGVGIAVNQNGEDVLLRHKHMLDALSERLDVLEEITLIKCIQADCWKLEKYLLLIKKALAAYS